MGIKYTITKEMEIAGQHRLNLPYESIKGGRNV